VSDGQLDYLPLEALPMPGETDPLIARFEIARLPSASVLSVVRQALAGRESAARAVAVFADPVFRSDDERVVHRGTRPAPVSGDHISFSRLRFSRQEADAIVALAPDERALEALDFDANVDEVKRPALADYRIVHFATHGLLDATHPELSGLVLSMVNRDGQPEDGFLRLHEIYNLKLNAEVVTLSACETALGLDVRGEGLVGLVRGFMYAGSPQIVASLWNVRDRATAELMRRFYEGLLKRRLTPEAALRSAQLSMRKDPRWSQPYFWAAFTLYGAR
jgi:CHAT domain-containing protein